MPAKVLHLATGNMFGGVETFLLALARHRRSFPDLQPEFATCFSGRLDEELRATGSTVHLIPGPRLSRPWQVWRARASLKKLLLDHRPEVVVSHATWTQMVFAPVLEQLGIPFVVWVHAVDEDHPWRERFGRRWKPCLLVLNSQHTSSQTVDWYPGVPREILYCPVEPPPPADLRNRIQTRTSIGTPPHAVVGVTACRLEAWKGHRMLIEALGHLKDLPDWEWWIAGGAQKAGEREYLASLEHQAGEAGIGPRIRFLGQRRDVPDLLAAADLHCQPNLGAEPFGIAYVEAMYAGLPTAATNLGGAREIITPECGCLVPPADAFSLSEVLKRWIRSMEIRTRLGNHGRVRAASLCSPHSLVPRIQSILLTAAKSARITG